MDFYLFFLWKKIPYSNFLDSIDNVKRVIDNRVSLNPNDEELRLCSHFFGMLKLTSYIILLMKKIFLKLFLRILKAVCEWLSDYIGTLPANSIHNAIKCLEK